MKAFLNELLIIDLNGDRAHHCIGVIIAGTQGVLRLIGLFIEMALT